MAPTTPLPNTPLIWLFDYDSGVAGSGDDFDTNTKSPGADYCYLKMVRQQEALTQDGLKQMYWGDSGETSPGYFIRYNKKEQILAIMGFVEGRTELGYVKEWFNKTMDNDESSDYICIKYADGDYYPFYDDNRDPYEYAKGWCRRLPNILWTGDEENLIYYIQIEFHVVFG